MPQYLENQNALPMIVKQFGKNKKQKTTKLMNKILTILEPKCIATEPFTYHLIRLFVDAICLPLATDVKSS